MILTGLSGSRFSGRRSPAKSSEPVGPLTADQTCIFTAEQTWRSNHGKCGTLSTPDGHNPSFSDGHAEWFSEKRFRRYRPTDPYPRPLWDSGWPWSWSWVEP